MLRKYRTLIITVSAALFAVAVIIGVGLYKLGPILPPWEKEKVEQAYFEDLLGSNEANLSYHPLIWYEENGFKEEKNVWRYVGKYGDCYAFLEIDGFAFMGKIDLFMGETNPDIAQDVTQFHVHSLQREVIYPHNVAVYLYHTKKEVEFKHPGYVRKARLAELSAIRGNTRNGAGGLHEWITDAQLEELTRDIERMAKQG